MTSAASRRAVLRPQQQQGSSWLQQLWQPKYLALSLLVVQTVGAIFAMRFSHTHAPPNAPHYLRTAVVVLCEIVKLGGSLLCVGYECRWNPVKWRVQLRQATIEDPSNFFRAGVPAVLYTVQNNLIVYALQHLSAGMYQVTYQLKILTTALLSVIVLRRHIGRHRWLSLFLLTAGVGVIEVVSPGGSGKGGGGHASSLSQSAGLIAVLCACMTSGLAGVYLELILKDSSSSIWVRNVQLAIWGTVCGAIVALVSDRQRIGHDGWLQGFTKWTWLVVAMQSAGGLIIAAVLKYADNILKCFGNAMAIIFATCISAAIGEEKLSLLFLAGVALVVFATYTYGTNHTFGFLEPNSKGLYNKIDRRQSIPDEEKGNAAATDADLPLTAPPKN